jgi:hypothetical protein
MARDSRFAGLERVLDSIFGPDDPAKGYELLNGYRNWVEHRGAPRIAASHITEPVPTQGNLATAVAAGEADGTPGKYVDWLVQQARDALRTAEVWCYRFAPSDLGVAPVKKVRIVGGPIRLPNGEEYSDIILEIGGLRVQQGGLFDPSSRFDGANTESISRKTVRFAGEDLDAYPLPTYQNAVAVVVRYAASTINGVLDRALHETCAAIGERGP